MHLVFYSIHRDDFNIKGLDDWCPLTGEKEQLTFDE